MDASLELHRRVVLMRASLAKPPRFARDAAFSFRIGAAYFFRVCCGTASHGLSVRLRDAPFSAHPPHGIKTEFRKDFGRTQPAEIGIGRL